MHSRTKFTLGLLIASALLLVSNTSFAAGTGSVATMDEPTHLMSVTFSPVHLAEPVVEITAEFKAHDQWGLALVGGGGTMTAESDIIGDQTYTVWEVGGQLRYYLLGDFDHGMQLGAEVLYVNVSNDDVETSSGSFSSLGQGLGVGPFVGYKIATDIGFTFDAQLGVARTFVTAEAEHTESGTTGEAEESDWAPLLNLNVGWSF